MKRVFLSLPLSGRTREEIDADIARMKSLFLLNNPFEEGEEIIFIENSGMTEDDIDPTQLSNAVTPNLLYLGAAIMKMAICDAVVFLEEYGNSMARGCQIEFMVARKYDIPTYKIDGTDNDAIRKLDKDKWEVNVWTRWS